MWVQDKKSVEKDCLPLGRLNCTEMSFFLCILGNSKELFQRFTHLMITSCEIAEIWWCIIIKCAAFLGPCEGSSTQLGREKNTATTSTFSPTLENIKGNMVINKDWNYKLGNCNGSSVHRQYLNLGTHHSWSFFLCGYSTFGTATIAVMGINWEGNLPPTDP